MELNNDSKQTKKAYEMPVLKKTYLNNDFILNIYSGKEKLHYDIRKYTITKDGREFPTTKGVRLDYESMLKVISSFEEVDDPSYKYALDKAVEETKNEIKLKLVETKDKKEKTSSNLKKKREKVQNDSSDVSSLNK
jgi:hypothetical protein